MKRIILTISVLYIMIGLSAQTPIGTFRDHLAYNSFYTVAASDDYVYAAGENGIMYIEKSQLLSGVTEGEKWSKCNGLSDVEIARIAYDKKHDCLVVAYANGNLDLIVDDRLTNVPDVRNKQMSVSKSVQQIFFSEDICYLVYQFGVVALDLNTHFIKDTWYTNTQNDLTPYCMAITDDRIYVGTNRGVFSIEAGSAVVADFGEWRQESELASREYNRLIFFKDKLYANRRSLRHNESWQIVQTDSVFVLENGHWRFEPLLETEDTRALVASDDELFLINWRDVVVFDGEETEIRYFYEPDREPSLCHAAILDDKLYVADDQNGVWQWHRKYNVLDLLTANGPMSNKCFQLSCEGGVLAAVAGGYNGWAPAYFAPVCNFFQNEKWSSMSSEFRQYGNAHDLINVAINPNNTEECFIATCGNGLYKCVNGKVVMHYDQSNSPLREVTAEEGIRVSGLCYDAYGNLWVSNSQTTNILMVLKTDGSWMVVNSLLGDIYMVAQHILVDSRGYKWLTFPRSTTQSLCVYDDNKTIDNQTDDRLRFVNMNAAAEVESSVVKCIAEDKNGRIWIGTNKGVKVIYDPAKVFDGTSLPRNVIMEQGGYTSVLLEFEEVSCIAVDGANRKWMGTTKAGVFLMNDSGTEELLHLTAENSVLLSNVIYDIAIDGITGEVFFSTDKGICSYRGTATEGEEEWYIDVKVFPNPVQSGYTGVIAVSGLMENSFCKIVDAAGRLIWQGYANGGELIWDGKDFRGNRPATGVYFVFSSSKSGKEKNVAKFLFVN